MLGGCGARTEPPPRSLPYITIELPPSTRNYQSHERGDKHVTVQTRFEMDAEDLQLLSGRLPCRLGPETVGPPAHAKVMGNDQAWYAPERATRHRGCDYDASSGRQSASFLVDVGDPRRYVVFSVIELDWNRNIFGN